jgi:hypothetical protein
MNPILILLSIKHGDNAPTRWPPNWCLPSGFLHVFTSPKPAVYPDHLIFLNFITPIISSEECKLQSSYYFLFLSFKYSLQHLALNYSRTCPLLNVRDQILRTCKTKCKITDFYILIFIFFSTLEDKKTLSRM